MGLIVYGATDDNGFLMDNPTVYTHGVNYFNKNDDRVKLNSSITGNGFDPFNGRFSSAPIKVKPNTFYHGFFGGYNVAWMDKDLKRIGYDSSGAGNTAVAKKTPNNCEYVEFSGPMNQIDTHMLIEGEQKPLEYIEFVGSEIKLTEFYSIGNNDYVDFDKSIINKDGVETPIVISGNIIIFTNQNTYIYLDSSREESKILGTIDFSIQLAQ